MSAHAAGQVDDISTWIADRASADVASRFAHDLLERCRSLELFPHRGTPRSNIRDGLRTIPFPRTVTIGYVIAGAAVVITGFAYRGQELAACLDEV